jgi:hypothetical protein
MMARKIEKENVSSIDFSNIQNIDAVSKVDPEIEVKLNKTESKVKEVRGKKFQFTESELIPLPSGGKLYKEVTDDPDILSGRIRIMEMSASEESILSTPRFIRSGSAIRMILDRCIKSDIDAKDILLFDSSFLMFHLRKISYGDKYNFDIKCSNVMCGKKFNYSVNISELEFNELPEDIKEPIEIKLPKSKYEVKIILPRLYHSEEITAKNSNRKKSAEDEDRRIIDNLLITAIDIIDTNGESLPKRDWEEFFESIPSFDRATLKEKTNFDTGVDALEDIMCPYCEEDYSGTIPIGPDFFRI